MGKKKQNNITKKLNVGYGKGELKIWSYTDKEGKTKPKYHKIRFIDSFKLMAASLDSLVNNLPEDAFNNLKNIIRVINLV